MSKKELIAELAGRTGGTKAVTEKFIDELVDLVVTVVAGGGEVRLPGLGILESVERAERDGRNPLTGEPLRIPRRMVPRFKPAKNFKTVVASV